MLKRFPVKIRLMAWLNPFSSTVCRFPFLFARFFSFYFETLASCFFRSLSVAGATWVMFYEWMAHLRVIIRRMHARMYVHTHSRGRAKFTWVAMQPGPTLPLYVVSCGHPFAYTNWPTRDEWKIRLSILESRKCTRAKLSPVGLSCVRTLVVFSEAVMHLTTCTLSTTHCTYLHI